MAAIVANTITTLTPTPSKSGLPSFRMGQIATISCKIKIPPTATPLSLLKIANTRHRMERKSRRAEEKAVAAGRLYLALLPGFGYARQERRENRAQRTSPLLAGEATASNQSYG